MSCTVDALLPVVAAYLEHDARVVTAPASSPATHSAAATVKIACVSFLDATVSSSGPNDIDAECLRRATSALCASSEHLSGAGGDGRAGGAGAGSRVLSFIALLLTRPGAHLVPLLSPVLSLTLTWAKSSAAEGSGASAGHEGDGARGGVPRLPPELHAPLAAVHLAALRNRWSVFFPNPGTSAAKAAAALAARDPAAAITLAAAPRAILEHAGEVLLSLSLPLLSSSRGAQVGGGPAANPGAIRAVLNELERCRRQVNLYRSEVFVPLRPHFIAAALGAVVGRHHDSLFSELAALIHGLAAEDFQSFYGDVFPGYLGSTAALPGLNDGQRMALLGLLPASTSDEPSMKRALGRLARDASLYLRVNRAALE